MTLFSLTYEPKTVSEIIGQEKGVVQLKRFVLGYKNSKAKIGLVHGPLGVGKTSAVYALARELDLDILEINSSDLRNAASISSFLNAALGQQSLFMREKIVLIDEIDNISGVKDRGCIPALLKAVAKSKFAVVATANDIYEKKMKSLVKASEKIAFEKVDYKEIAAFLIFICSKEKIVFEEKAINTLARGVDGDVRAALLDLELCCSLGKVDFATVLSLHDRKREQSIVKALGVILKSSRVDNALGALDDVSSDYKEVMLWLDANMPKEYTKPADLSRAYEILGRVDVFGGRIRRRQHWRFLSYIYQLLTAGISSAKEGRYEGFVQYRQTMRLLRMWQFKMKLAKKKEIAAKLAKATHTSTGVAHAQIGYLQQIFKGYGGEISVELELSDDEAAWLRG